MRVLVLCLMVVPFVAATVMASETVSFTNVPSQAGSGMVTYNVGLTGGYTLGDIDWDGFATALQTYTYGSELRLDLSGPLGAGTIQLGTGSSYAPGATFTGSSSLFSGLGDPAGTWTFDFYESYDDGGDGLPDANWDYIDFFFGDWSPPTPPPATDLGTLTGDTSVSGYLGAGEVHWYMFTIGPVPYCDITTNNSTGVTDTELGLYEDVLGALIATDDDDGFSLLSTLSFGTGSGMTLGDPWNLGGDGIANGEDGPLGPGTYYLAFGGYNTTFGTSGWDVTSTSSQTGDYTIDIYIPEPASLVLLALGGFALLRRR